MFPGSRRSNPHQMVIGGVPVISENWEVSASSAEVLDYYRRQMLARGWTDVTEESFNLSPEEVEKTVGPEGLQDPNYAETYKEIVESCLVLRKGAKNMVVKTEPGTDPWVRTVKLSLVATPSITEFSPELGEKLLRASAPGNDGAVFEVSENRGGSNYRTKISTTRDAPRLAFERLIRKRSRADWQPLFAVAPGARGTTGMALLENGDQYVYVSVRPSPAGKGTSVFITEVTESHK